MTTLSLILTINNRSAEVSRKVAESLTLPGNQPDELVVVLDRPTEEAEKGAIAAYSALAPDIPVKFVEILGKPEWLGPARAWNAGFHAASGDLYYMISSETVQDPGNIDEARTECRHNDTATFGACHNSEKAQLVTGADPGLLVSAAMPRPLGFICCIPATNVHQINGFDEAFMQGFWYDDDDFFLRLWKTGLNFTFTDSIHGIHLDHTRPDLETPEGQEKINTNRTLMVEKHGTIHPWPNLLRAESKQKGRTTWLHL